MVHAFEVHRGIGDMRAVHVGAACMHGPPSSPPFPPPSRTLRLSSRKCGTRNQRHGSTESNTSLQTSTETCAAWMALLGKGLGDPPSVPWARLRHASLETLSRSGMKLRPLSRRPPGRAARLDARCAAQDHAAQEVPGPPRGGPRPRRTSADFCAFRTWKSWRSGRRLPRHSERRARGTAHTEDENEGAESAGDHRGHGDDERVNVVVLEP